jgi:hypothetical protein
VAAADKKRSGFELNFLSYSSVREQPAETLSGASTVTVAFALQKSDVVLQTALVDKQTLLQLLAVVVSTTVSLFSVFAIGFRMAEHHLLRRMGWSAGPVAKEAAVAPLAANKFKARPAETADDDGQQRPPTPRLAFTDLADSGTGARAADGGGGGEGDGQGRPIASGGGELPSPSAADADGAVHLRVSAGSEGVEAEAAGGSALSPSQRKYQAPATVPATGSDPPAAAWPSGGHGAVRPTPVR